MKKQQTTDEWLEDLSNGVVKSNVPIPPEVIEKISSTAEDIRKRLAGGETGSKIGGEITGLTFLSSGSRD